MNNLYRLVDKSQSRSDPVYVQGQFLDLGSVSRIATYLPTHHPLSISQLPEGLVTRTEDQLVIQNFMF